MELSDDDKWVVNKYVRMISDCLAEAARCADLKYSIHMYVCARKMSRCIMSNNYSVLCSRICNNTIMYICIFRNEKKHQKLFFVNVCIILLS